MNWVAQKAYFSRALPSVTCRTATSGSLSVGGDLRGGESPNLAPENSRSEQSALQFMAEIIAVLVLPSCGNLSTPQASTASNQNE